ncbi:MAG TPA: hypothetical protein VF043_26820 [Ktedonobacteraceae bacterium]
MIPHPSHDLTTQHGGETAAAAGPTSLSSSSSTTRTYSTCWVPLEGIIQDWLDVGREATLATALAAAGAALFALSHEKHALRCYTQGWRDAWRGATEQARQVFHLTGEHLSAAAQQWSLVVILLDTLCGEQPQAVPADELSRIRALAQAARAQQVRLCTLAEEVRADFAAVVPAQQTAAAGIAPPRSPRSQHQEEGMPWPSA